MKINESGNKCRFQKNCKKKKKKKKRKELNFISLNSIDTRQSLSWLFSLSHMTLSTNFLPPSRDKSSQGARKKREKSQRGNQANLLYSLKTTEERRGKYKRKTKTNNNKKQKQVKQREQILCHHNNHFNGKSGKDVRRRRRTRRRRRRRRQEIESEARLNI